MVVAYVVIVLPQTTALTESWKQSGCDIQLPTFFRQAYSLTAFSQRVRSKSTQDFKCIKVLALKSYLLLVRIRAALQLLKWLRMSFDLWGNCIKSLTVTIQNRPGHHVLVNLSTELIKNRWSFYIKRSCTSNKRVHEMRLQETLPALYELETGRLSIGLYAFSYVISVVLQWRKPYSYIKSIVCLYRTVVRLMRITIWYGYTIMVGNTICLNPCQWFYVYLMCFVAVLWHLKVHAQYTRHW
jgi:hypothetical protein